MRSGGFERLKFAVQLRSPVCCYKGRGGLGPSTLGTGHRMDNREPQSRFQRANRARRRNNNTRIPLPFCIPPPITSPTPQPPGHRPQPRKILATHALTPSMHTATSPTPIPGEGAHHPTPHPHIMEDTDARQGPSNPYPLQTKISGKFWTPYRQMVESLRKYTPRNAGK